MPNELPVLRVPQQGLRLPENAQWENRFYVRSESSGNLYTIAQHKRGRYWGCSCVAWITRRHCKHLDALNLPPDMIPHEVQLSGGKDEGQK